MTLPEFKLIISKLSKRWKEVNEDWWFDEAWGICRTVPVKALEDWARYLFANQRQYPLPGEFRRFYWDNESRYKESHEESNKALCGDCIGGFVWAEREQNGVVYEYCFRCQCNQSYSKKMPLWNPQWESKGHELKSV